MQYLAWQSASDGQQMLQRKDNYNQMINVQSPINHS
jgi:hypothetical protein